MRRGRSAARFRRRRTRGKGRPLDVTQLTAVILCGGKGTRAYPHTREVPKPLLEVAGEPVLAHVLRIYARQGVTRFLLSAGYLAELVEAFAATLPRAWDVEVVDTGEETNTAGRILGPGGPARPHLPGQLRRRPR